MFLSVSAIFVLRACVGVVCFICEVVMFRTCALAPAPACGFAVHTEVWPVFDSTSPAKSKICFARHRAGNLAGKTKRAAPWGPLIRQVKFIQFASLC